jgi:hypothetical protein
MMRVSLYFGENSTYHHVLHQSFYGLGRVHNYTFDESPDENSDWVVTFGSLPITNSKWWPSIPRSRKIAILLENPRLFYPNDAYLSQHSIFITPGSFGNPPLSCIYTHPGVPWFYGITFSTESGLSHQRDPIIPTVDLSFHFERQKPEKTKLLSLIASGKSSLPGHRLRHELAGLLLNYFGRSEIDIFGFGNTPVARKDIALDSYLYSIVIENDFIPNYVTEKIADAFLGFSSPIYIGAPNVQDFFPEKVTAFSLDNPETLAEKIVRTVGNAPPESTLLANRQHVLLNFNLLYHLAMILDKIN